MLIVKKSVNSQKTDPKIFIQSSILLPFTNLPFPPPKKSKKKEIPISFKKGIGKVGYR